MASQLDSLQIKIQTQLLRATFLKNMTTLKEQMPAIYDYYKNYTPIKVQLALDDNGNVNLLTNGQFVYQDDPKLSSRAQVDLFISNPPQFDYEVYMAKNHQSTYEHERVIYRIFNKRRDELGACSRFELNTGDSVNFIAIMGSGLGYHIEALFEKFAIRSAYVYEPDPDCFYAMLHTIDIQKLLDDCHGRGGEISFKIGGNENEFVNEIYHSFKRQGFFNLTQMYQYRHYLSDKTTDAFKKLKEVAHRYQSGWGFCEDEIIGISHTLTNISANKAHTLLQDAKFQVKEPPVFIIGNGPSLDECLPFIKENQDNAIIISSGTSLKPLLDYGIRPDMHVEQERPASIYQWVKKIGHEQVLKETPLICLNTVFPPILALFKQPYVMLKAGDAGTSFIHDHISDRYEELYYCNPTVTNASTAGAIAMGFKKLFLFGLDYGFKSEELHHAKDSIYTDIKGFKMQGDFKVAGNFVDEVLTTKVFDNSRGVLEMLLEQNPDVECVNSSDGAKILLTTPCRVERLPNLPKIKNKVQVVNHCLASSFDSDYIINRDLFSEFGAVMSHFDGYMDKLLTMFNGVKSKDELTQAFSAQYLFINSLDSGKERKLFYRFFSGSLNFLQTSIMSNVNRYNDEDARHAFIQYCIKEMRDHFIWLLADLKAHYNQPARA